MQEQRDPDGIEWTRILRGDGTGLKGFTWNVITGCQHGCMWKMPNDSIAGCYAKTVAERGVARSLYPDGFEVHQFHPERLSQPLRRKRPAGIFLDSMSDLLA